MYRLISQLTVGQHIVDTVSIRHIPICTYKLFGHVLFCLPQEKNKSTAHHITFCKNAAVSDTSAFDFHGVLLRQYKCMTDV